MTANDPHAQRPGCERCGCDGYKCKAGCGWLALGSPCRNPRYAEVANAADAEAAETKEKGQEK